MSKKIAELFGDFDFSLLDDPTVKEDAVREEVVKPLLNGLGYFLKGDNKIVRSKTLEHPIVKVGTKKRAITNYPDYLLQVDLKDQWVLDAKAPDEEIKAGEHVEQVFFYAIHPDVRVPIYALCNGKEFIAFHVSQKEPLIYFHLSEIDKHWDELRRLLSPEAFGGVAAPSVPAATAKAVEQFDYLGITPPKENRAADKQSAKRHFGVHGYFTKQPYNVVQEYIKTFTRPGDVVLDPFGGTGVTVIESLMLGRKGIHIDLNPLSVFIVKTLIAPIDYGKLYEAYEWVQQKFEKGCPKTKAQIRAALKKYPYPKGIRLMKDADVEYIEELFAPVQLAQLACLKHIIGQIKEAPYRNILMLMFSGLLNKINLTYHASEGRSEGRGDSSIFRYYRYRLAPEPAILDIPKYFHSRYKKVVAAKREMEALINKDTYKNAIVAKGTATNLRHIEDESIDYIYTDPPYGSKIAYLDLSTMFNAWLDLPVTKKDYSLEAIEGGELEKSKHEYFDLLTESIREMHRVLKYDRWMSFVFAHQDPAYWHMIVDAAEKAGFEYAGAVAQNSGKTSFKKRQNPFTVLQGQLIINFKKVRNPKTIMKVSLGADIFGIIMQTIEGVIAKEHGATIEQINDELIIRGLELGFLDVLSREYQDLTPLLMEHFDYDEATGKYHIRRNNKFKTQIPLDLRVRYYTYSYLKRMEHQKHDATFDDIVLHIMPLLKNGVTPEDQTILSVLEEIADRVGEDRWRLKVTGQQNLFDPTLS